MPTCLTSAFTDSRMGIAVADADGRIRLANPAFCAFTGHRLDELRGRHFNEITHADDRDAGRAAVAAMLAGRASSVRLEKRYLHRDGREVWVDLVSTVVRRSKGRIAFVAHAVDITGRRRAEEHLVSREAHYHSLYQFAGDYFFIIRYDAAGRPVIHDVNDRACEMHGYAREDLVGRPVAAVETAASLRNQDERIRRLQRPGDHACFETEHRRKDGSVFPVEVSARVIQEAGGAPYILSIGRDISVRREAERRAAEHDRQVRELMELRDRMLAVVGHDLRDALGAIVSFADLLQTQTDPEGGRRYAGLIKQAAGASLGLLTNLLEWTRLQTGNMELRPEAMDLREAMRRASAHVSATALLKQVSVRVNEGAPALALADPAMVDMVCRNLLANAIKYSPLGASVEIDCLPAAGKVICSVLDQGAGIPPARLPGLFDPGPRHSQPGTAGEKGSGLGLVLCREFLARNGGSIRAANAPGGGAVFTLELPAAE
jgi:PAS domain S-box-containing protein